jgi:hypothetical protein
MTLFEKRSGAKSKAQFLLFLVWLAVTIIAFRLAPDPQGHGTHQQLGLPPCTSVIAFDRPCPACGMTTSWAHTVRGQFVGAFIANPLGSLTYLVFTLVGLASLYASLTKKVLLLHTATANRVFFWIIVVFFVFGLIRFALTPNYAKREERNLRSYLQLRN